VEVECSETTVATLRLPNRLNTLMTQTIIELLLVYPESGSKTHERRSEEAAEQQDHHHFGCMSTESAHGYRHLNRQNPIATDIS